MCKNACQNAHNSDYGTNSIGPALEEAKTPCCVHQACMLQACKMCMHLMLQTEQAAMQEVSDEILGRIEPEGLHMYGLPSRLSQIHCGPMEDTAT